jgi:dihydrofolate reductase
VPAVIYSMSVTLDGFVAGPNGEIDWSGPDEELHQFHNDQVRELGAHLLGRRLYETMLYWETVDPSFGEVEREFAEIWQALPKVVFSRTLERVEGSNTRLASGSVAEELEQVRASVSGDVAVGGAELAAACIAEDLVDDFRLFVKPVVLGEGRPFFPPLDRRLALELVETRTFAAPAVYLRYRRVRT